MDAEDPSPVNPFHFWKGRIQGERKDGCGEQSRKDAIGGSSFPSTSSRHHHEASKHHHEASKQAMTSEDSSSAASQGASKRRPPPPRPTGTGGQVVELERSMQDPVRVRELAAMTGSSKDALVQERLGKASKDTPAQETLGRLLVRGKQDASIWEGRIKPTAPTAESKSIQDVNVQERIKAVRGGSDADSYTPSLKKSPMHVAGHRTVKKTTSNPVNGENARHPIKSSRSLNSKKNPYSNRYIPTIQTIRASTGDQLSVDDLELYRPQRGTRSVKVLEFAKKIDAVLLSPQHPVGANGRRGSSGDISRASDSVRLLG